MVLGSDQLEGDELGVLEPEKSSGTRRKSKKKFDVEEFFYANRIPLTLLLVGVILIGFGVFLFKKGYLGTSNKIEVLESTSVSEGTKDRLVVEIAGAVERPGVYELSMDDRVEDLLIAAGGLSADADRVWIEKMVNRAAKLADGQKLYIPRADEQSDAASANFSEGSGAVLGDQGSGIGQLININTATQKELESLWGIGPVYAQNIIEHRPYSSVEELLTKKIIKSNVYERNKDLLTVY